VNNVSIKKRLIISPGVGIATTGGGLALLPEAPAGGRAENPPGGGGGGGGPPMPTRYKVSIRIWTWDVWHQKMLQFPSLLPNHAA